MSFLFSSPGVTDLPGVLGKYARKLTLTPARIAQADVDAIYTADWDEAAFVDVLSVCAIDYAGVAESLEQPQ